MPFDYTTTDLPICEIIPQIIQEISSHNTLLIHAAPGAGKSTLVPLVMIGEPWTNNDKILVLEPRRIAAKSIAHRMAEMLHEEVGQTVGYRVRFDTKVTAHTKIEVVTEGILTRMLQNDNTLEGYSTIIFDEFHERSIHSDLTLALCKEVQQVLRPELRLIIMSATLDIPGLVQLLNCPVVSSAGRSYEVNIQYTGNTDPFALVIQTLSIVKQAVKETGDILVFLPGQKEISELCQELQKSYPSFRICPLHGSLSLQEQQKALWPAKDGKRKIVVSTNIAETSLTIEGIRIVIDSGYARMATFDPRSNLTRLETKKITLDSATQRAGRAGRLGPGICYRMWSKASEQNMVQHRIPEILESDLTSLVLELANWGINNINSLAWLNPPPAFHIQECKKILHDLEALDSDSRITSHGRKLLELPCHPRIGHMLLLSQSQGYLSLACDLAAIIEEKDPLGSEAGIDITLRVEALRRFRNNNGKGGSLGYIEKVSENYRRWFRVEEDNQPIDPYGCGLLISYAFPERIAGAKPGNNAQFQLANGSIAQCRHTDDLANEPWLAIAHLDARDGLGKIFLAAPLQPKDLASLIKEREWVFWDESSQQVVSQKQLRIGSLILKSSLLPNPSSTKIQEVLLTQIQKTDGRILNWSEEVDQLLLRIEFFSHLNPENDLSAFTKSQLIANVSNWLSPYLVGLKSQQDIQKLSLNALIENMLSYELRLSLDTLCPSYIEVPTGSRIKLTYRSGGLSPLLAVRLQELFGMKESPKIGGGKVKVLLHLLSPSYKPVQVTDDLTSFWSQTYHEVKKELKRRYPKHAWPDDPWTAIPIKGVVKKNR